MAVIPLSGTDVRLLSGIPFSSNYRETRYFGGLIDQQNYFENKRVVHRMEKANFLRWGEETRYAVDAPIDKLHNVNYMMFQNTDYSNKWFYAFVNRLEFENKYTTWVYFELDVFQTWIYDVNIQPSFVRREHRQLWTDAGNPVRNTLDEGLDYGTEYDVINVERVIPSNGYKWLVIISKERLHGSGDYGIDPSFIGVPQPLTYYITPFLPGGETPLVDIPDDDMSEPEPITSPETILKNIYEDEQAVDNIVSIYITESPGFGVDINSRQDSPDIMTLPSTFRGEYVGIAGTDSAFTIWVKEMTDFLAETLEVFDNKWENLDDVNESKLMMYPYTVTTLDDFKGNRQDYAMENVNGQRLDIIFKGSMGLSNKTSWAIKGYNRHPQASYNEDRVSNEHAIINENPTDVPVLNEMLAAFLQGNRNSMESQRQQAFLSGGAQIAGGAISAFATGGIGAVYGGLTAVSGMTQIVDTIQQQQAQKQDIDNQPPDMSKMGSNTAYQYGHDYNMFGYKTNEVKKPNMRTRKNWNYIETDGIIIHGNINNEDLNELKQVFDNGITLWHTDDVGNYNKGNGVG